VTKLNLETQSNGSLENNKWVWAKSAVKFWVQNSLWMAHLLVASNTQTSIYGQWLYENRRKLPTSY
jgi:hypothetical protein